MGKQLQGYGPVFSSSTYCPFLSEQFLHYSRLFFDSGRLFVDGYAYDDFMVVPRGEGSCTTSTIHDLCQIGSERVFSVKCSCRRSESSGNCLFTDRISGLSRLLI